MRWGKRVSFAVLGLILVWACGVEATERPNILFLISDDQRPDTIRALGNLRIETPNLDRLVAGGVTFERAVCANPICVSSRAEILTGCSGFTSGVRGVRGEALKAGTPSWARTLAEAGYETWYVGKWHTTGRPGAWGYTRVKGLFSSGGGKWWEEAVDWKGSEITGYRGWVFQSEDGKTKYPDRGVGLTGEISRHFADAAIDLIASAPEEPFFLHVNFTAPHDPLLMPPGWEGRYDEAAMVLPPDWLPEHPFEHGNLGGRDELLLPWPRTPAMIRDLLRMYYAVISDMDTQIGRILKALDDAGERDDTIVIFASDHGMGVGSHGLRGKQSMYEHTINVPLIVAGPGVKGDGRRTRAQVYLRDLFPTTCDLAGVALPKGQALDGVSFAPVLRGEADQCHADVFCYFRDDQRMVRDDRYKLIYYPALEKHQLFDLVTDPYETVDLSGGGAHGEVFARLQARLEHWQAWVKDPLKNDDEQSSEQGD